MAGNTRQQANLREQANSPQPTAPPQPDNTAISTQIAQMMAMMNAMSARMDAMEARSRPPTPILPTAPIATPQSTAQSTTPQPTQPATQGEDKRWRPEEVGYFDGTGDVFAFTDRLASVAAHKGVKLVQGNLVSVLQLTAFNWYHYELTKEDRDIHNLNLSIEPWCKALIERFGPTHSQLMTQLEACQYTRKDAAEKKDATAYIQDVMRITKGLKWKQNDGLMTAFHHFEAGLQRDLEPPNTGKTALTDFIKQVQLRQSAWYSVYSAFGKPRPPDPRQQQPYRQQYRPPQQPQQQPHYQQHDRPPRPSYPPNPKPAVYWADEEDWEYDPPSDSYHAYPSFQPPGHTPRRYGNTHDGGGTEAMANWASAGEDHRCNHEGCTHYH